MKPVPAIVVHGGAGTVADDHIAAARAGAAAAAAVGLEILRRGGSAVDAVQAAVRALEDNPEFNAGVGAVFTREGTIEMDASIMDGSTLAIGAVGAVENLRRPVDLARQIMEDGEHVLLVGPAAWDFARERGFAPVPREELSTERARVALARESALRAEGVRLRPVGGGTVGAAAIDASGHVAAATSTGGMTYKRRGRVGDTPICGAGTYADDLGGAASATGHGETISRVLLTRRVVDELRHGASASEACCLAIAELADRVEGSGGVIAVDRQGRIGLAHNTPRMTYAYATLDRPEPVSGVELRPEQDELSSASPEQ